jgi:formate hydrogenlyase transcriptional activator
MMEYKNAIENGFDMKQMDSALDLQFIHEYNAKTPMDLALYQEILADLGNLALERHYILELGKDITKIREKDDLIRLFSIRIKEFFYFNHSIITVIDKGGNTYSPFLLNPAASPLVHHKEYDNLVASHFTLNEPFISRVLDADGPVLFNLEEVMDNPGAPPFLRANYEVGLKTILMTPLRSKSETIGFLHVYSDTDNTFTKEFISIIKGIAPQISNSVTNIIINERIRRKQAIDDALLKLGHKMAGLRDKNELADVLLKGLQPFIPFNNLMLTISDEPTKTYRVFLTDAKSAQINQEELMTLMAPNVVADDIYDVAAYSYYPVIFDKDMQRYKVPPNWYKLAIEHGASEILLKVLPNADMRKFGLVLLSDQKGSFSEEAIQIIETISGQLSSIIRNLLSMETIASREREKSFLLDFSSEIVAVRTKENLAEVITRGLKRLFNCKLMALTLLNDGAKILEHYMPQTGALIPNAVPLSEACCKHLLGSAKPVIFNANGHPQEIAEGLLMKHWKKIGVTGVSCCPLRVGDLVLGILWLLTDDPKLEVIKGICSQISLAIFNIRSYQQLLVYKEQLEEENEHLHEQISTLLNFSEIVGDGSGMKEVYEKMEIVAPSRSTVIILGETGTGKELIARAIHNSSLRKNKNMIKVNCAALPVHLIESELFGHEKGAFTGATERRIGKFELAHEGTIFLDEIGELPLDLQVKLLRVIQEREFERLGGSNTVKVDVRIVAATNRDLPFEVNTGKFRSDLYYRLHVFPISLPPLRNRVEDIPALANYFLQRSARRVGIRINSICPKVMEKLLDYNWPGNIRELEHLIERSILLNKGSILSTIHLPGVQPAQETTEEFQPVHTLEEMEKLHIINILKNCSGKISGKGGAADLLEIPASTLHSKMKKLSISRSHYHSEEVV